MDYVEKTSHRHRLKKMILDDVLEYCFTQNISKVIPAYKNGEIVNIAAE